MNFGKLSHKIELQQYISTRTDSGSFTKSWSTLKTLFAQVDYRNGNEKTEADQEQGFTNVDFIIRKCGSLNATEQQRIVYNNEYFDIVNVNPLFDKEAYFKIITIRKTVYQQK